MKKILVIDGNSIVNRAFYGVRMLTTKSGKYTNAIYGTVMMISRQLDAIKPDYCAVAFDVKHPTFRHRMYAEYKAGRKPTPEELISQFKDIKEILSLMGIRVLEIPGWEADDIQGTIAKMAHELPDTESYIYSGDRDLLQLIDDKVTVLIAGNKETTVYREREFTEKYGIPPSLFVNMKGLMGDSSDNIPGVAGIGEKTAASLVSSFGTIESIYENIDDKGITKGVREKLINGKENAFISRKLSEIDTHAPLGLDIEDLKYRGFDKGGLYARFRELELNSFIEKFKLEPCMEELISDDFLDTGAYLSPETPEITLDALKSEAPDRISLERRDGSIYIGIKDKGYLYSGDEKALYELISGKTVIGYDLKKLCHRIREVGADYKNIRFLDLMLYEYVLNPGSGNAEIPSLLSMFVGITVAKDTPTVSHLDKLEGELRKKIKENELDRVLDEIELPLLPILAEIEENGFKIVPKTIHEFGEALGALADDLANKIYFHAGEVFNLNSPKQLGEILYTKLGLVPSAKRGKNGFSTDAQTLEEMRHDSPIIDDILEYRQVTKLKSTYTNVLVEAADDNDRIHTDFKQALTATGRLSSAEPNLQNIPIKTKLGREMRRFFVAEEGYTLVDADYSQIELRLLAHISDDYTMKEAFANGEDIHTKTAAAVFRVPEEMVDATMRKRAKAVNFGIVYGISGFSLSKDIGTTVGEANKYIKNYFLNYPSIDEYLDKVVKDAERDGYTTTLYGRRRYIPELKAQNMHQKAFGKRVAMNAPIQGSAADIMKIAMINVYRALKEAKLDARIVMQVHDELIIEVRDSDAEACRELVKREMENAFTLSVPLTVDATVGKNWLEQE